MKSSKGSPEPRGNQRNLKKQRSGAAPAVLTGLLAAGWEAGSEARGWLRDPGLGFTPSAPHGPALLKHSSPWH